MGDMVNVCYEIRINEKNIEYWQCVEAVVFREPRMKRLDYQENTSRESIGKCLERLDSLQG